MPKFAATPGPGTETPRNPAVIKAEVLRCTIHTPVDREALELAFDDPLPEKPEDLAISKRLPRGSRYAVASLQASCREGDTQRAESRAGQAVIEESLTPYLLGNGQAILLRYRLDARASDTATTKTLHAFAIVRDERFHLSKIADDPLSSETLILLMKARVIKQPPSPAPLKNN